MLIIAKHPIKGYFSIILFYLSLQAHLFDLLQSLFHLPVFRQLVLNYIPPVNPPDEQEVNFFFIWVPVIIHP